MPDQKIYTARNVFTGEEWLKDHSVIVTNGSITDVSPATSSPAYDTLLPAFIDLQIYGAYGKLFSVFPEADTLGAIHKYCVQGGAYWFQPTIATNTAEVFFQCIDAVRDYRNQGGQGCIGLHIEGPWINSEKRGAHIGNLVHEPTPEEVKALLNYGKGVISMITLAPENCSETVLQLLSEANIIISAGHSNATFEQSNSAFGKGVTAVTHLYNAMSGLQHRAPGLVGATLLHPAITASIIADGHHVDFAAIKIAKELMKERLFLITDAVTETSTGPYPHQLTGDKYVASGILSGSALTMMKAVKNMIHYVGTDKTEAIKMATAIPAKVMKMENVMGKIRKGCQAHLIATDETLSFVRLLQ